MKKIPYIFLREKSPADFTTQFVKDLQNANTLTQIRWIFDHEKMDAGTVRTKVLAALSGNKSMLVPLITNGKLQTFFPPTTLINTPEDFITELSKDNVFNEIFK